MLKAMVVAGGLLLTACGAAAAPAAGAASPPPAATGSATARRGPGGFRGTGSATAGRFGGGFLDLAAAASYLGLSTSDLQKDLQGGKSLAAVAQAQGKSVQGLDQALVAAAKARLDQAVSAGRMSAAQEQQQLQALTQRIGQMVDRVATATATPGA